VTKGKLDRTVQTFFSLLFFFIYVFFRGEIFKIVFLKTRDFASEGRKEVVIIRNLGLLTMAH